MRLSYEETSQSSRRQQKPKEDDDLEDEEDWAFHYQRRKDRSRPRRSSSGSGFFPKSSYEQNMSVIATSLPTWVKPQKRNLKKKEEGAKEEWILGQDKLENNGEICIFPSLQRGNHALSPVLPGNWTFVATCGFYRRCRIAAYSTQGNFILRPFWERPFSLPWVFFCRRSCLFSGR